MKMKKWMGLTVAVLAGLLSASCELMRDISQNAKTGIPHVTIAKPTNYSKVSSNFVVSASAYDLTVIETMELHYFLTNGGTEQTLEMGVVPGVLASFYETVSFPEHGVYQLWVKAKNVKGVSAESKPVIFEIGNFGTVDTTPPIVAVVSPTNKQVVSSMYSLSGSASDSGTGVSKVFVKTDNGSYMLADLQNNSWTANISLQATGYHTNYIYAQDYAGNSSSPITVIVHYQAGLPYVVISAPASMYLTGSSSVAVSGTAGATGVSLLSVAVSVNGGGYVDASGLASWTATANLTSGTNSLRARVITYQYITNYSEVRYVVYDNTKPSVLVSSPLPNAVITNLSLTVSGTANDTISGPEGIYLAVDAGVFGKVDASTVWSAPISLGIGTHTIKVYAKDLVGNTSVTNTVANVQIVDPGAFFTVYFAKPAAWTSTVKIYYWQVAGSSDDCGASTNWPGNVMQVNAKGWYYKQFNGHSTHLIFNNNGSPQTADLSRDKDGWYSNSQWYDEDPYGPKPPKVWAQPGGGKFLSNVNVTLKVSGENVTIIRYTLNGSDPKYGGTAYSDGTVVNIGAGMNFGDTKTLKLYALNNIGEHSVSYVYTKSSNILPKFIWENATVYFVITDRFYNGNPANDTSYGRTLDGGQNIGTFHGGDLAGLTMKINEGYFNDLGVNVIWITAPYEQIHGWVTGGSSADFKHYAYHGYYVLDYTCVDKNMGTTNDLKTFIDTAHSKGIRVIFDIVMNHTGYSNIKDLSEFMGANPLDSGTGVLKSGWENATLGNYHDNFNYSSGNWVNWWGQQWVRAGLPGYDQPGGDDLTSCLSYLPDFKTENPTYVNLPPFMTHKPDTKATYLANYTVRMYLVKWITDWVLKYGVDGYRVDTAKHVEKEGWAYLKQQSVTALAAWKANNPTKALDDLPFWMTAEVWGHGPNKSDYHTVAGFNSVLNFGFQGAIQNGLSSYSGIDSTYAGYAGGINVDYSWNILSYISSHDTSIFYNGDAERQKKAAALLLLCPGGVQIYYGDENCRAFGPTGSDPNQGTRSDYPWPGNTTVLAHWQKIGQFRNNHVAIGAGQHTKISTTPYIFSRYYNKDGYEDKVIVVLGANGSTTVQVASLWTDGTTLRDFYSGQTAVVTGGAVTFNASGDTILIEEVK